MLGTIFHRIPGYNNSPFAIRTSNAFTLRRPGSCEARWAEKKENKSYWFKIEKEIFNLYLIFFK